MRYEGKKDCEIAKKLNYSKKRFSQLCAEFKTKVLEEYSRHKFGGNSQSLSNAEEEEILSDFKIDAEQGKLVTVQDIKKHLTKDVKKILAEDIFISFWSDMAGGKLCHAANIQIKRVMRRLKPQIN